MAGFRHESTEEARFQSMWDLWCTNWRWDWLFLCR